MCINDWTNEHKYSFNDIVPGLREQSSLLELIDQKENGSRTIFEKQLYGSHRQ